MSVAHVTLQAAYILHHRPYRDTSALLEVFTREHGRVGLVARGSRGAKSRTQGLLQPFRPLLLSWVGRGELMTLTGCESAGAAQRLSGQITMSGFYINELLLRLLHRHDAHPALFEMYAHTLTLLENPAHEQRVLRIFEKRLLQELGYALVLNCQVDTGEALKPDTKYSYQLEKGPVNYSALRPRDIAIHGHSLLALADEELHDPVSLRETRRLMRASLALYLGDKPLHSRKLANDFYRVNTANRINTAAGLING